MSDALAYSVELAAERSSERYYLEKRLQMPGLYLNLVEHQLKKLGLKHPLSDVIVDSLNSLKHDARVILDALIESGYKYYSGDKYFIINDNQLSSAIDMLDVEDAPIKYLNVFRKLKEKFKYKLIRNSFGQINDILAISQIAGYSNAIDSLAETGYKIKKSGITSVDIEKIKHTSEKLWKETLKDFTTCLYKNRPAEFVEYFRSLSIEDKKSVIKSIFNCNKNSNHFIITWLDKNYSGLVREVGLSLV